MTKSENVSPNRVSKRPLLAINIEEDARLTDSQLNGPYLSRSGTDIVTVGDAPAIKAANTTVSVNAGSSLPAPDALSTNLPYTQLINAITNPGPNDPTGRPQVVTLSSVSNLTATWGSLSGVTFTAGAGNILKFEFDWDPAVGNNGYVNQVGVHAVAGTVDGRSQISWFVLDKSLTHHTFYLTKEYNSSMMGGFTTSFNAFKVYTIDALGINFGADSTTATFSNSYSSGLNAPQISVANANNGYVVTVTNTAELAKSALTAIDIWEYENATDISPITDATNANILSTYKRVYLDKINPATIISPNLNKRWVRARFSSESGIYTDFSKLRMLHLQLPQLAQLV